MICPLTAGILGTVIEQSSRAGLQSRAFRSHTDFWVVEAVKCQQLATILQGSQTGEGEGSEARRHFTASLRDATVLLILPGIPAWGANRARLTPPSRATFLACLRHSRFRFTATCTISSNKQQATSGKLNSRRFLATIASC